MGDNPSMRNRTKTTKTKMTMMVRKKSRGGGVGGGGGGGWWGGKDYGWKRKGWGSSVVLSTMEATTTMVMADRGETSALSLLSPLLFSIDEFNIFQDNDSDEVGIVHDKSELIM